MKTQLSKPARSHARYTEEYKKEALELWRASGRSAANRLVGSHPESELLLLGPNKAAAAAARLTTVASAGPKELMWVG
jgi:hypothetical protein